MLENPPASITTIFRVFLRLGLTSFGGPIAHLGYFRREFVDRRRWLSAEAFGDLVALCQFLPGPASSQIAYSIGMLRRGLLGAMTSWLAFTLPSSIVMIAAGITLARTADLAHAGWLHGLKLVAAAVVAQAIWSMANILCRGPTRATIALASAIVLLLVRVPAVQIAVIAAGMLVGRLFLPVIARSPEPEILVPQPLIGKLAFALFLLGLVLLPLLSAGHSDGWISLFGTFYRTGTLVFGGGHVVLPLLQAEVVPRGWMSNDTFLAGYGIAQALPGPLFTFAGYIGAAKNGEPSGWLAGAGAIVAILLSPMLLVTAALPVWQSIRNSPSMQSLLAGASAAVVGVLLAAFYDPIFITSISSDRSAAGALLLFAGLQIWKLPTWIVVIAGLILGTFGLT